LDRPVQDSRELSTQFFAQPRIALDFGNGDSERDEVKAPPDSVRAAEFSCCNQRLASDAVYQAQLGMGRLKILAMLLCRPAREVPQ
jgi:hypothetical protein